MTKERNFPNRAAQVLTAGAHVRLLDLANKIKISLPVYRTRTRTYGTRR